MKKKTKEGVVVSDKMAKTRVVEVTRVIRHPIYQKTLKKTTRIKAHDEEGISRLGNFVEIEESKPISRGKSWKIKGIIK